MGQRTRSNPAQTLTTNLFVPCGDDSQQPALQALLGILDGILINYIALRRVCSKRKKQGKDALRRIEYP